MKMTESTLQSPRLWVCKSIIDLPQGLCNSPGSFMRMMIFGDQNYLRGHNLKLAPNKCFFLRKSVRFLCHILCEVNEIGVWTNPSKTEAIMKMASADLMEADDLTPSSKRVRSYLGMINYYQHFVASFSAIAKPLFSLLLGQKRKIKVKQTPEIEQAYQNRRLSLVETVVLAHPDFAWPFMLITDASLDGICAVLSQIKEEEAKASITFASKSIF